MTESPAPVEEISLSGHPHEPIILPIRDGPPTGYAWRLDLPEGLRQIEAGPLRQADPATAIGADISGALRVEADHPGDFVVTARLARPWQPDQPARIIRFTITAVA